MRGSFFTFRIANTGMHTARANLNVTAHNAANMGIHGFSRQVTVQSALPAIHLRDGRGMYGTGSSVNSVIQMRDQFIDRRFWGQQSILGEFNVKVPKLSLIEAIFNDLPENSTTGVLGSFNDFFSRLQELSVNANDPTFRLHVIMAGETLAQMTRNNAEALQQQQRDLNGEVRAVVTEINSLGRQISILNAQIRNFEFDGSNANDLRDQRALLIDRLSELANIEVVEHDFSRTSGLPNDRRLTISLNGYDFVNHDRADALQLVPRGPEQRRNEMDVDGLYDIQFANGAPFNIYSRHLRGVLRGLIDIRDGNGGHITNIWQPEGISLIESQLNNLGFSNQEIENLLARLTEIQTDNDLARLNQELGDLQPVRDALNGFIDGLDAFATGGASYVGDIPSAAHRSAVQSIVDNIEEMLQAAHDGRLTETAFENRLNSIIGAVDDLLDINDIETEYPELYAILNALSGVLTDIETNIDPEEVGEIREVITEIEDIEREIFVIANRLEELIDLANDQATVMSEILRDRINDLAGRRAAALTRGEDVTNYDALIDNYTSLLESIRNVTPSAAPAPPGSLTFGAPTGGYLADLQEARTGILNALGTLPPADVQEILDALEEILVHADALQDAINDILNHDGLDPDHADFIGTGMMQGQSTTMFRGIPFYQNRLNDMIRVFVRAINEGVDAHGNSIPGAPGHRNGYSLEGTTGRGFFTWTDHNGNLHGDTSPGNFDLLNALNFDINQLLLLNPQLLQCSSRPTSGESDNATVLGFIHINDYPHLFREGRLIDFIIATSSHLSIDLRQSNRFQRNYTEMTIATQNQRESISGVDMNEEMLNMARFSHLFQVNARMISTMNEVYDTLINRLGIG